MTRPIIYTDQELIQGLADNDNLAISAIYKLYQPMLTKWMMSRGGSETDAYDVFQEGLLVLFEKSVDNEFALTCKLSTYLFAVCKRIWFKKSQQNSRYSSVDLSTESDDEEGFQEIFEEDLSIHEEKEANFEKMEQSLNQLGSPCAELLKSFYIEDKSMMEIAKDFGYTNAENAKTQKYKCLTRLKKLFFSSKMMVKTK